MENKTDKIEELDITKLRALDFIQDGVNRVLGDKINELIKKLNEKEL